MEFGPRDIQHVLSKSYFAEKVHDVEDKNVDARRESLAQIHQEMLEQQRETVPETKRVENPNIEEERRVRNRSEREDAQESGSEKKRSRPANPRPFTGSNIDMEA